MQCIRRNECFRIARPERIIRRTGFGKQPKNSIPLNTKGILNGCPLYFHRPATRQNSTDHRGIIRTFVPLSTASPRQDGNKFALHPLIRIFPKYSNAATLKKNLAPPAGCTIFAEDRKRFGNLCVQTRTIALIFILSLIVLDRMRLEKLETSSRFLSAFRIFAKGRIQPGHIQTTDNRSGCRRHSRTLLRKKEEN